ncbi:calcium-binding protein [Endozoicomonas sp. ISHI1]|uniref:calcium-binding protein n=1 Tax=Endozoicomonas sp. ISHI1 TaxID=2825882 RepID=UPI002149522F|nr:calcium-binding protein [Endozoicomonas sp. ISHI1]
MSTIGISNAEAAVRILQGHGASTSIASAADSYSDGDYLKAGSDLIAALDALATMADAAELAGKTIGKANIAVLIAQVPAIVEKAYSELNNDNKLSDATIQDILGLGLGTAGMFAMAAGSVGFALAATTVGVALGAYSLVRPEEGSHIWDTIVGDFDDASNSLTSPESSNQLKSPTDPVFVISNDPNITITDEPLQSTDINLSIETDNATGVKVITITDENGKASIVTVQPKEPLDTSEPLSLNDQFGTAETSESIIGVHKNNQYISTVIETEGRTLVEFVNPDTGETYYVNTKTDEITQGALSNINEYTGPVDNSLLDIDTHTTQGTSENSHFDPEQSSSLIGEGYLEYDSNWYALSTDSIVNDNGIHNTLIGDIIGNGLRPGNHNLNLEFDYGLGSALEQDPLYNFDTFDDFDLGSLNSAQSNAFDTLFIDPLVLDLNGDGVQLEHFDHANVFFDIDNDGIREQSGWVSPTDGLLAVDLNNNGKIDDVSELFSEYYKGAKGQDGAPGETPYANGFEALRTLDSNSDGVFNNQDAAWSSVKVWVDADGDAVSDAGELKSLEDAGVVSVNLNAKEESGEILDGNEVLARGDFVQNVNGELKTREAIAANFLSNPDGHTFVTDGNGKKVSSQSGFSSYAAGDAGETVDVVAKGVNSAYGGRGNDTLIGDADSNWLAGGGGSDSFNAGAGDDVLLIDGDDNPNNIQGGDGIDIVKVLGTKGVTLNLHQSGIEVVEGGRGNDIFVGGGGSNVFIKGGEGNDVISGGLANDALSGEDGNDSVYGGKGNDIVRGHRGRDRLSGGEGNDVLEGGLDDDILLGDAGNDVLNGGQGDDRIDGGEGVDVARFSGSYSDYRITRTSEGIWVTDTVSGRDGSDFLTGVEKFSFSDVSTVDVNLENYYWCGLQPPRRSGFKGSAYSLWLQHGVSSVNRPMWNCMPV